MEEVHAMMKAKRFAVHFPIECRTTICRAGFLSLHKIGKVRF